MRVYTGGVSVLIALFTAVCGAPPPPDVENPAIPTDDLLFPLELTSPGQPQAEACQRYPLLVNFADLGWNDWIVAPRDYDAGYCLGSCGPDSPNTLPNTTNHAIVQARVHNVQNTIPKPCCVPTELEPLSVLYVSEENNVVLRKYKNMKVKSCGCR